MAFPFGGFANRYLVKLWPFRAFGFSNFIIARPAPQSSLKRPSVSVVMLREMEAGNIKSIFERVPNDGYRTENSSSAPATHAAVKWPKVF